MTNLVYMAQVIFEALRMYPPTAILPHRITTQDTKLGDKHIPKGTVFHLNLMNRSRDPTTWQSPNEFCPSRFHPDHAKKLCPTSSVTNYFAFGHGRRNCIGKQFSLTLQRVLLSMLLTKYHVSLPEDSIHKDKLHLDPMDGTLICPKDFFLKFDPLLQI